MMNELMAGLANCLEMTVPSCTVLTGFGFPVQYTCTVTCKWSAEDPLVAAPPAAGFSV